MKAFLETVGAALCRDTNVGPRSRVCHRGIKPLLQLGISIVVPIAGPS